MLKLLCILKNKNKIMIKLNLQALKNNNFEKDINDNIENNIIKENKINSIEDIKIEKISLKPKISLQIKTKENSIIEENKINNIEDIKIEKPENSSENIEKENNIVCFSDWDTIATIINEKEEEIFWSYISTFDDEWIKKKKEEEKLKRKEEKLKEKLKKEEEKMMKKNWKTSISKTNKNNLENEDNKITNTLEPKENINLNNNPKNEETKNTNLDNYKKSKKIKKINFIITSFLIFSITVWMVLFLNWKSKNIQENLNITTNISQIDNSNKDEINKEDNNITSNIPTKVNTISTEKVDIVDKNTIIKNNIYKHFIKK